MLAEEFQVIVPAADLYAQYLSIKDEIDSAIAEVIRISAFVKGPFVEAFEVDFANASDRTHCVSCDNGTDALFIAMKALGLKPDDEVITTAHSWISTSSMITYAGGVPVFVDTDPRTFTIDPSLIEARITPRTVGIIPVHLCGQPADMDAIMDIAARHGLWVIEDCAQAHGARYRGQQVGTFGTAATYSFYPGKNLGAMGDAGAIVTSDAALAERMRMVAQHGGLSKHDHRIEGINSRLDGLQAAILSVKLRHLPDWTRSRQRIAEVYLNELQGVPGLKLPTTEPEREHVWHLFMVEYENRDDLRRHLSDSGIETLINYPVALPFLPAYSRFGHRPEDFPVAYRHQSRILSLPIFAEMTVDQIEHVIASIRTYAGQEG